MVSASVLSVGEPLVCFAPDLDDPEVYRRSVGGAEVNTAVGLARLGHHVQLLTDVGADPHGEFIRSALQAEGVATDLIGTDPTRSTGALLKERPGSGDPWVRYVRTGSPASVLDARRLPAGVVHGQDLVHVTGVFLSIGPGPAALARALVRGAVDAGVPVSFDVNHRPALLGADALRNQVLALLPCITHLLCNEEEAALLTGCTDVDLALASLRTSGPVVIIVKRGARGAVALIGGERFDVPAVVVGGPIDTVGAGDAFNAGWLHAWLVGEPPVTALAFAAFAASLVVAHPSDHGGFPRADDAAKFLASARNAG